MTPLAWLISFWLPACGLPGAQGVPAPAPLDFAHLTRPQSPNTALAAPAGFQPAPDIITASYPVSPAQLYATLARVVAAQPRTYTAARYPDRLQDDWVVRSAIFNFPDIVAAQIEPAASGDATLVLYSRSVYGYSDLGANRRRVQAWLAALDRTLNPAKER